MLTILVTLAALTGPQTESLAITDAAVIRTAVESFFHKEVWQSPEWQQGEIVAVRPKYSRGRPDFKGDLASALESFAQGKKSLQTELAKATGAERTRIEAYLAYYSASLERLKSLRVENSDRPPATEISKLALGERIVVRDVKREFGLASPSITMAGGKKKTLRTCLNLLPPAYSKGGRYALLSASAPWSIHHADLAFFLERKDGMWKVLCVNATFYV